MKLGVWLKERGLSQAAFATMSGVPQSQIARFVLGRRIPNIRDMGKIVKVTEGAVVPGDFYDPVPAAGHARPEEAAAE